MNDVVVLFTDGTIKNFKAKGFKNDCTDKCFYIKMESGSYVILPDCNVKAIGYKEDMNSELITE